MTELTLTKIRFRNGLWEGRVSGAPAGARPDLHVTHQDAPILGVTLTEETGTGHWTLAIPVPAEAIGDGVQTLLVTDAANGETLGHVTLIAGDPLAEDLLAEVDLLRAELDMLKRAFRRHCRETE